MCFSATASFSAACLIGTVGAFTLSNASSARELPLASVPLVFAVQQAIEGALWLTLPAGNGFSIYLANGFAICALVLWPILAPTAAGLVEDDRFRCRLMWALAVIGALFAAYSARDIAYHPYRAVIDSHSLCYINDSPYPGYAIAVYVAATCGAYLLSTHRALQTFGIVVTLGLAVSVHFFLADIVSVWCFFAAIASGCLLFHFSRRVGVPA